MVRGERRRRCMHDYWTAMTGPSFPFLCSLPCRSKACQRDVPAPLDNPTPAPPSPSSAPPPFPPLTWVEVTHGSHPRPLGRHDHACAVLGDSMYLFGGISRGRLLNGEDDCGIRSMGCLVKRRGHRSSARRGLLADLWRLDLPSMEWEMLHPGTHWGGDSAGPCPAPAAGHGMVAWGATLLTSERRWLVGDGKDSNCAARKHVLGSHDPASAFTLSHPLPSLPFSLSWRPPPLFLHRLPRPRLCL